LRLEALLLSLSPSYRQVGVFDPTILPQSVWPMNVAEAQLSMRRSARSQAVGCDLLRLHRLVSQQATQQLQRRLVVMAALEDKIERLAFVIDGTP
jgi:hypothetical protein